MAQFIGTLRIEGDRGAPLSVKAKVDAGNLVLVTEGVELGTWPLASLQPQARGAGVGLSLGGDPVVIDVSNADAFMNAVAAKVAKVGKVAKRKRREPAGPAPEPTASPKQNRSRPKPSPRLIAASLLGAGLVAVTVMNPTMVGAVALFLGLVLVVVASGAVVDAKVALRIPFGLQAMHLMVAGVAALLVGVGLTIVG